DRAPGCGPEANGPLRGNDAVVGAVARERCPPGRIADLPARDDGTVCSDAVGYQVADDSTLDPDAAGLQAAVKSQVAVGSAQGHQLAVEGVVHEDAAQACGRP